MFHICSVTKITVNPNLIIEIYRREESANVEFSQKEVYNIVMDYFKNMHPVFSFYSLAYTFWHMIEDIESIRITDKNGHGVYLTSSS